MKKIICLAAVACLSVTMLAGCGDSKKETETTTAAATEAVTEAATEAEATETQAAAEGLTFEYNGVSMAVKQEAAPIIEALGDGYTYTEEKSCAFEGLDKNYTYSSVVISTYPDGETDYINAITLMDDTVSTAEGISIGDSQEKVEEVYGADCFNGVNAYIIDEGDTELTIGIQDGKVNVIRYVAQF